MSGSKIFVVQCRDELRCARTQVQNPPKRDAIKPGVHLQAVEAFSALHPHVCKGDSAVLVGIPLLPMIDCQL